jgi:glutamyl/glutaminyl-tRNA synthetase
MNSSLILVDIQKLNFINSSLIKEMNLEVLYEKIEKFLKEYEGDFYLNIFSKSEKDYNLKIIKELQTRLVKFSDFKDLTTFFYNDFQINDKIKDLLVNPKMKIETIDFAKK